MVSMKCLGIESTAHTFGASVVDASGHFLSNEKASFTTPHKGMVPREVLDFHKAHHQEVLEKTLAPLGSGNVDVIAISQGPGIGTLLAEGLSVAQTLSNKWGVPLLGVNHAVAHLEIGVKQCGATDPVFLYVSGGNTQVLVREKRRYRIVGETLDIGIGNLLDKAARHMGLGFPGGPKLYELSLSGKRYVELPYNVRGMDVCFSGMYTDFVRKAQIHPAATMALSLQETAFDIVCEVAERALSHFGKSELVLAGGVACSKILQQKAAIMCRERGAKMHVPENAFLTDNGAMIAWNGLLAHQAGQTPLQTDAQPLPHWRTDDVPVAWRNWRKKEWKNSKEK